MRNVLRQMLDAQRERGQDPTAIFTDFDNSFWKEGHQAAMDAARELSRQAVHEDVPIATVTGRASVDTINFTRTNNIRPFATVIGAVGTEIYHQQGNQAYRPDEGYSYFVSSKGYKVREVVGAAQDLIDGFTRDNPAAKLSFQNPEQESLLLTDPKAPHQKFKVSLHFFASSLDRIAEVAKPFSAAFPDYRIVVSEEIHHNRDLPVGDERKYCLDVVPVTKLDAINYTVEEYGIEKGLIAGDSGNDIEALLMGPKGFASVLVGGHTSDARAAVEQRLPGGIRPRVFQKLDNGRIIFVDTSPNRFAAQSILAVTRYLQADHAGRRSMLQELRA